MHSLRRHATLLAATFTLAVTSPTRAADVALCPSWNTPEKIGQLDFKILDEVSGLAVSKAYGRLYMVNDSGDGPAFYVVQRDGSGTSKVEVRGFKPFDVEDLSIGPCPDREGVCLAIADIGDNRRKRKSIEVVFVREKKSFDKVVDPVAKLKLTYPDGPRNAEALAILPDGDILIVSKEEHSSSARPAGIYRVSTQKREAVLTKVGEIDVPALTGDTSFGGLVTGIAVDAAAEHFVLLTYDKALEFKFDLLKSTIPTATELKRRGDVAVIPLTPLPQQEAIAYDEKDLIYTTELAFWRSERWLGQDAPIMRVKCSAR